MSFLTNLSIKNKLVGIILLTTIAAIGLGITLVIIYTIQTYKDDMKNNTIVNAKLIGDYCVTPLSFEDSDGAEEILERLATLPYIVNGCVYNNSGIPFAIYEKISGLNIPASIENKATYYYSDKYFEVFQPIVYQGQQYGTIYLKASTEMLNQKISNHLFTMFAVMGILILISYFLAAKLQIIISKPILELAEVTGKISTEADYSHRVTKPGNDEIGKLYDGFNNMLEQIQQRQIERDKVEYALRESEERFRNIYENSTVGIYQTTSDGKILMANPTLVYMLGFTTTEEFKNYNTSNFYINENERDIFIKILRREKTIFGYETTLRKLDGSQIIISESARLVTDENGKELYLEGFIEDITDRKRYENALIDARIKAEEADKLKSEFLAQISHEIRTPVNVILNFTSLIKDSVKDKVDQELFESFQSVDNAGLRIIRTIDLILNMSEIQTGTYEPKFREVDVYSDILLSLQKEFRFHAASKKLDLVFKNSAQEPIVSVDEYSVSQIFANLIDNSIKYTKKGKIEVTVKNEIDDDVTVCVADTGMGIAAEYLDHLFEPFSQEEVGYTRKYDGTGLGLALVKKYCEINNAEITVQSIKGEGAAFTVVFKKSSA